MGHLSWSLISKMKKYNFTSGLGNAFGVVSYVALVALVMNNAERIFGKMENILGIIAFLLLFTFSAAVVGTLILGKPLMLFLDGHKKEAIRHLIATLGWLFLAMLIVFIVLLIL